MKPRLTAFWHLYIYVYFTIFSLYSALKIKISSQKMMKVLANEQAVNSLFLKLIISNDVRNYSGFLLLSALLASEIAPFREQYIKYCRDCSIYFFLSIQKHSKKWGNLDLSQIISADCISATQIKFHQHESTIVPFFMENGIFPLLSNNFKPSQWAMETFFIFIRDAVALQLNPDWSSWCGDIDLKTDHFDPDLWNSSDKLWRFLNFKCLERMNRSKRITVRWKFLSTFKWKNDSPKEALMKIISILAVYRSLKDLDEFFMQEQIIIKSTLNSLLDNIVQRKDRNEVTRKISRVAVKLVKYCGLVTTQMKYSTTSSKRFLNEIYDLLHDEPSVNSSWFLNLIYVALRTSGFILTDAYEPIIDWIFNLDTSTANICQLLEIAGKFRPKLRAQIILRLSLDHFLFSSVYKKCPSHCKSSLVPFENRIRALFSKQFKFPKNSLELKIPYAQKDHFWHLLKIIIERERTIFTHNSSIFMEGFDLCTFRSLDVFFEHFLKTFLAQSAFYHYLGSENDDKPIIIPSIQIPAIVVHILVSVLARSVILNFKIPFYIHFDLFKAALDEQTFQFHKIRKLKNEFYNYRHLSTNSKNAKDCDNINRNEMDLVFLVNYLIKVSSSLTSHEAVASDWDVLRLIEKQQKGIQTAIKNNFPSDIPLNSAEIYSLIFNRK